MVINNLSKSNIKILMDINDLENAKVPINEWLKSPEENIDKLLKNLLGNINFKSLYVYSYKFIVFYIFIDLCT